MAASAQILPTARTINVASVPQRSPFRYPGGKTWLVPYVRLWLRSHVRPLKELVEPFAGGAIVGLTAAFENLANKIRLVELDSDVAAVWQTILNGQAEWLAQQIAEFRFSEEAVRKTINQPGASVRQRAFATILRNRVQRGGILAPGAGLMKDGENGRGLASRWYPETLSNRIRAIAALREKITFVEADGLSFIRKHSLRKGIGFFVDPPYTIAGRRLYKHSEIDHRRLFQLMSRVAGDFLMTYDDSPEIRQLVCEFRLDCETVAMKNTHNSVMEELLIGPNLNWLRNSTRFDQGSLQFELEIPKG
ncbi:MAG: DNA adenine methylase [Candidatus Acidiferrales bacterium]